MTGRKRGETDQKLHPPLVTLAGNLKIGNRVKKSVQGAGPVEACFSDLSFSAGETPSASLHSLTAARS